MKISRKGDPPKSFLIWKRAELEEAGLVPNFNSLQNPEKAELIQTLLAEQEHLCSYCGRPVGMSPRNCHVDHFWPQSYFDGNVGPDRRLDHQNLFLSCGLSSSHNEEVRALPRTCGEAKNDWFDEVNHVLPSDENCERRFIYDGAGRIAPMDPDDLAARNMIERLNLNDASLVLDRKKVIVAIEGEFEKEGNWEELQDELLCWWRKPDHEGKLVAFSQVRCRYVEEEWHLRR